MIALEGTDRFMNKLNVIKTNIQKPNKIIKKVSEEIDDVVKNSIATRSSPDYPVNVENSGKWQPYKTSTKGFKAPSLNKSFSSNKVEISIKEDKYLYQHYGTKANKIVPKGEVLKFNINGKEVFSKGVQHPGLPSRPILGYNKKSINNVFSFINKLFNS